MNNRRYPLSKKSILFLSALGAGLVFLWVVFYILTINIIKHNMTEQTKTTSDAIMSRIEDEILVIDDIAYSLAHYDRIQSLVETKDTKSFYEEGERAVEKSKIIIGNQTPVDNAVIYREDGKFYRLKGKMSNTALKKVYDMIKKYNTRTIAVSSNGMTYLGSVEAIYMDNEIIGYVVLFLDRTEFEKIFLDYKEMDYLGMVLTGNHTILCSNREVSYDALDPIRKDSVFYKEKVIGFTGFSLLVYCDRKISEKLSVYFAIALPATILLFIVIVSIFIRYLNRNIIQIRRKDMELENEKTLISLLKKQINAHFTVNTLNVVRALINKGNKQEAAATCEELSDLLRYANAVEENISLMEEFHILEQYAAIMKTRYPDKFTFNIDLEDEYADIPVPRMLIQPIVENSIVHGLSGQKGEIRVYAELDRDVTIHVCDNGVGMDKEKLSQLEKRIHECDDVENVGLSHMALINIQKRIGMVCGEGYGISIKSEENAGTEVIVRLKPVKK